MREGLFIGHIFHDCYCPTYEECREESVALDGRTKWRCDCGLVWTVEKVTRNYFTGRKTVWWRAEHQHAPGKDA
jgi:hypothetical protein